MSRDGGQPIAVVDAFTARPFAGNPAGVCILAPGVRPDASWMQRVGAEMNLAETAFVEWRDGREFGLRWFTPTVEVDLCGHATLASAHLLFEDGSVENGSVRFLTRSGVLTAERRDDGWIQMDLPATPAVEAAAPDGLFAALGARPVWTGKSRFDYLVELSNEREVRDLAPDLGRLRRLPVRGLIATAPAADPAFDFVSRFFAPAVGVDEDPVTGSAHCALTPFWAERLGKNDLRARQISSRGGELRLRLAADRVEMAGQAVTVWRGTLLAGPPG